METKPLFTGASGSTAHDTIVIANAAINPVDRAPEKVTLKRYASRIEAHGVAVTSDSIAPSRDRSLSEEALSSYRVGRGNVKTQDTSPRNTNTIHVVRFEGPGIATW